jgi:hypothetical protein
MELAEPDASSQNDLAWLINTPSSSLIVALRLVELIYVEASMNFCESSDTSIWHVSRIWTMMCCT